MTLGTVALRRILLFVFAVALPVGAQVFVPEQVVFPITDFKPDIKHLAPISVKFGTGFCLDTDCRFVGTNYHVAHFMGKYVRIKGVFSAHCYLDSGPDDVAAENVTLVSGNSLKFTAVHDLAIYEMRHPIKSLHGIGFDAEEVESSTEADIYAYPFNWNPKRRLFHSHAKFIGKNKQGLLIFGYEEGHLHGGVSGGIVIDSKTKKIIGVLNGIGEGDDRTAFAVPIKELSSFVMRSQPYLQATLFPKTVFVSPVAADLYPPYVWHPADGLSQRTVESSDVIKLRNTAERLADSMRAFSAIETLTWGRDSHAPTATDAYETLITDGEESWRHEGESKLYDSVPIPLTDQSIVPGAEWSWLPRTVGTEFKLRIHEAPDAVVGGRTVHVFQYEGHVEDEVCGFRYVYNLVLFNHAAEKFYDCYGEVWTDESGNILRISRTIALTGPMYHFWEVMTYGWLEKNGRQYPVPVTIAMQGERKSTYWCRGLFTDYEMFGTKARLVLPADLEQAQKSARAAR